jgi:hypothetical protein
MKQTLAIKTGVADTGKEMQPIRQTDRFTDRNLQSLQLSVPRAGQTLPLEKVLRGGLFVP